MKPRLLELIACPTCRGDLVLTEPTMEDNEVASGLLLCSTCQAAFPVKDRIPRLLPHALDSGVQQSARAFGHEWLHFADLHPEYRDQFLDWIRPLQPQFFEGKVVLDAGCGMGRHAYHAATFGARDVVAMDVSEAVLSAEANLRGTNNVHVIQGDIFNPPFRSAEVFDFVYSIGVLHHLPDPAAGFTRLAELLRPGGTMFAWVYGYEGNQLVHRVINPLRTGITSKLPAHVVRIGCWPLAIALHAASRWIYSPLRNHRLAKFLPSHEYIASLSSFSFRQNYSIVFDHLVAPIAFYIRRDDFEDWFRSAHLTSVEITQRNGNSWRGRGQAAELNTARAS